MKSPMQALHDRALKVVKSYLSSEGELIEILVDVQRAKGYREFGKKSLTEYAIALLGLSEDPAETLVRLARKSLKVPALLEKIRSGEISITNARLVCPVLTAENQEKWLPLATALPKRELENA